MVGLGGFSGNFEWEKEYDSFIRFGISFVL